MTTRFIAEVERALSAAGVSKLEYIKQARRAENAPSYGALRNALYRVNTHGCSFNVFKFVRDDMLSRGYTVQYDAVDFYNDVEYTWNRT